VITREELRRFNWPVFVAALMLVAVGLVFIWSASFRSEAEGAGRYYNYPLKQLLWAGVGLGAFAATLLVDYRRLRTHAYTFYFVLLALLVLVLITGRVRGVTGWFRLGPVKMQPSEFMKIAYVLVLARCLMYSDRHRRIRGLVVPFLVALVPMALILKQPDLGTALVFLPVLFVVLAVAGARRRHLVAIAALGLASLPVFWQTGLINDYQKARVLGFIHRNNPERVRALSQSLGVRFDTYQQAQSVLTIGSGRIIGKGLGRGTQTRYEFLPEDHTDFIFSVIGEESGLAGTTLVIILYLTIGLAGLGVARRAREPFGRLVVIGMVALIEAQALINLAVAEGFMPVTGLTLPFVSYGGSSLLVSFIAVGLIINVGMRPEAVIAEGDDFEFDD